MEIEIEHNPPQEKLDRLGIASWPVWFKEESRFPWTYDTAETCYILDGEVVVTPAGGKPVRITAGDLVTFPAGMSCTWEIRQPLRKRYSFG
jgi:uncharacterized cupin superfamily protein